jgi:hypothetical protein
MVCTPLIKIWRSRSLLAKRLSRTRKIVQKSVSLREFNCHLSLSQMIHVDKTGQFRWTAIVKALKNIVVKTGLSCLRLWNGIKSHHIEASNIAAFESWWFESVLMDFIYPKVNKIYLTKDFNSKVTCNFKSSYTKWAHDRFGMLIMCIYTKNLFTKCLLNQLSVLLYHRCRWGW